MDEFTGYSKTQVFNDFLEVSAISIANNSDPSYSSNIPKEVESRERRYMEIVKKYDKAVFVNFCEMLSALVMEMELTLKRNKGYSDIIGKFIGHDSVYTQFADLTGKLIVNKDLITREIKSKGFFSMTEPFCSSGSLIYAVLNQVASCGYNPTKHFFVLSGDVDIYNVYATYIQLSMYGIPAVVLHQSKLTAEIIGNPYFTPVFILDDWYLKCRNLFKN